MNGYLLGKHLNMGTQDESTINNHCDTKTLDSQGSAKVFSAYLQKMLSLFFLSYGLGEALQYS